MWSTGFKEEALPIVKNKPKTYQKHTYAWVDNLRQKKLDVVTSEGQYYHFDQFGSHMTFLYLQKILKIGQIENKLNPRSK